LPRWRAIMRPVRLTSLFPALALIYIAHATGCGSKSKGGDEDTGFLSGGSGGATSGSGNSTGNSVGSGFANSSGSGSGSGGSDTCAATSSKAEPVPVDLFIMLDKSGSMDQNNKWINVSAALISFFQDPMSAGLSVALRFFP